MGYKTCFTDHSLFGFSDASSIHTNKILKFTLSDIDHVICVSNTSKENTVLRASLNPQNVSVIPNAIDATMFTPDPSARDRDSITVVVMSRLVYRKGIDFLLTVIPEICRRFPKARFIIGGDGPKKLNLEEMIEKNQLHNRVELLGAVRHNDVRNVLVRGDIFLNCSLTEAFCVAIVEAASCGMLVVSTKVGGVPEVLPDHIIRYAAPTAEALIDALCEAIGLVHDVVPQKFHEEVKQMYNWYDVAERTEVVYDSMVKLESPPLIERLKRYYGCGSWAGPLCCGLVSLEYLFWRFVEWLIPASEIERAIDFPYEIYEKVREKITHQ